MLAMTTVFTSCTKDIVEDIMGLEEYYITLDNVSTNLLDANGNDLTQAIYDDFKFEKGGKSQSMGKAKDIPYDVFEKSVNAAKDALQQAYKGNMPQGGWIRCEFSLRAGSAKGVKLTSKTIIIQ